jgi:hypothetical protein
MTNLLEKLQENQGRGSKPRCHWLTHGESDQVAARLAKLIESWGEVSKQDHWMPEGFNQTEEAELHKAEQLLAKDERDQIRAWWFRIVRGRQTAPSFDIASTCTIVGRKAILLIEAKAYAEELRGEEGGKPLSSKSSEANHEHIGKAIAWANERLIANTNLWWKLSRDRCYQMSNRFAAACKLTELGFPVILVYLGFLNANEMKDKGQPLGTHQEWERLVKTHSQPLLPNEVWGKSWRLHNQLFIPLIRSVEIAYDQPIKEFKAGNFGDVDDSAHN